MRKPIPLIVAAIGVFVVQATANAQAPELDCPEGALELDVTPLLTSTNTPGAVCGSPRNPTSAGPCDDGYYQLTAPPELWPTGIPFGTRTVPSIFFNVNGAISFDTPLNYFAPERFPSPEVELIAAHIADVDLRDSELGERNPGRMLLCRDFAAGRIVATWSDVGFYDRRFENVDLNTYQVVLEKSDLVCTTASGESRASLGVEIRYVALGWYASSTGQGNPLGLCDPGQSQEEGGGCQPARAGMNPAGLAPTVLDGSGTRAVNTTLLEGALEPGVFRFLVHPSDVVGCACPEGTEREGARCLALYPTADGGDDLEVIEASDVVLDATGSRDDRGRALSYAWTQVGGPAVVLVDQDGPTPGFVAPEGPVTLTFEVEVCNTLALCDSDEVVVAVIGLPDVVVADQVVTVGEGVSLDASASTDPQALPLEFIWTQVAGPSVTMTGPTTPRPRFSAPTTPGELVFQVFVCNSYSACANTMARVDVTCRAGFVVVDGLCQDIDECTAGTSPCDPNATCENTAGAFTCDCVTTASQATARPAPTSTNAPPRPPPATRTPPAKTPPAPSPATVTTASQATARPAPTSTNAPPRPPPVTRTPPAKTPPAPSPATVTTASQAMARPAPTSTSAPPRPPPVTRTPPARTPPAPSPATAMTASPAMARRAATSTSVPWASATRPRPARTPPGATPVPAPPAPPATRGRAASPSRWTPATATTAAVVGAV